MLTDDIIAKLAKTLEEGNKKSIEAANRQQTEEIKQYIRKEINEVKERIEGELNRKTTELENKYEELKLKYNKLEKNLKKNNIIIFGLESAGGNLGDLVISTLNNFLGLKLELHDIDNVYTIGKQEYKKPIIVKLISYFKKQQILKNSKKFKGTNISVTEELTFEEIKENKVLRHHLKEARSKNLTAVIKNKKLIVNGHTYTAQELIDEEEEDADTEQNAEKESIIEDELLKEAKDAAYRLNNSAPSTPIPTGTRREVLTEEEPKEEEVETGRKDPETRKTIKITRPVTNRIMRSSRINSNK